MIQKLLSNTRMIRMIFIKILNLVIQIKNEKYWLYMDGDMLSNKKLNPVVTELFIRGSKLNISLFFITQYYFAVPKNIRLNSTHIFSFGYWYYSCIR